MRFLIGRAGTAYMRLQFVTRHSHPKIRETFTTAIRYRSLSLIDLAPGLELS